MTSSLDLPHAPAGVYVHWPFCARKCPYCDFYTFGREHPSFDLAGAYGAALEREIRHAAGGRAQAQAGGPHHNLMGCPRADTIYFGGGTPSLIEPATLGALLGAVRESFEILPGAEITMEINPTAVEVERLGPARELGVNRLSVGCQSFQDKFLKTLGRDHDAAAARRTLRLIRELGFDNVSLDLMFGLPDQSVDDLARDLDEAISFGPEHVSIYGLTLHEGTPFRRWSDEGTLRPAGEETWAEQYELIMRRLGEAGYVHYEISNWCRPGRRSRHNWKYWGRCDVHAFGASAHGVRGGRRYSVPRDLKAYLNVDFEAGVSAAQAEPPPGDARSALGEILMLCLRRLEGVGWDEIREWAAAWVPELGVDPKTYHAETLERLEKEGMIENPEEGLRLTRRGLMIADAVMGRFF